MKQIVFQLVAIVSPATKQTSRINCVAGWFVVSSVTPFGLFSLIHSLLRSLALYPSASVASTCAAMVMNYMCVQSLLFFSFQPSLPSSTSSSSSNNAYTQHTFHSHPLHISLFFSFFSSLLFKRRNSVQSCLSFFALDVEIRSSSPLQQPFT